MASVWRSRPRRRPTILALPCGRADRRVGGTWQAWSVPPRTRRSTTPSGLSWDEAPLAPVVLVRGAEGLLSDRAVSRVVEQAVEADPGTEEIGMASCREGGARWSTA